MKVSEMNKFKKMRDDELLEQEPSEEEFEDWKAELRRLIQSIGKRDAKTSLLIKLALEVRLLRLEVERLKKRKS